MLSESGLRESIMFKFWNERALIRHNNHNYSGNDIKKMILPRAAWLQTQKCKKLILTADDNFEFLINFLAGIFAGKELFLLLHS